jgi:hypothetical protein
MTIREEKLKELQINMKLNAKQIEEKWPGMSEYEKQNCVKNYLDASLKLIDILITYEEQFSKFKPRQEEL